MTKPLNNFVSRFGTKIELDESLIVKKHDRYFLLKESLMRFASGDFFYGGIYLGKNKSGKFFPSFNLLNIIAQRNANKVTVDRKTEWLFICGRDVFAQGIKEVTGSAKKNEYVLVLNSFGECLGFGRVMNGLHEKRKGLAVENVLDIGDFLRREQ